MCVCACVCVRWCHRHGIVCVYFCMCVSVHTGESEKPCVLKLVDDLIFEEEEELRLRLGTPKSNSPFGASVGPQEETLVKIQDTADSKS